MSLWEHVNFWTALGSVSLGALVGLAIGVFAREMRRLGRPPNKPLPMGGVCPACQERSLRRMRGGSGSRWLAGITGRWPYACSRCGWSSSMSLPAARPHTRPTGRPEPAVATNPAPAIVAGMPPLSAIDDEPAVDDEMAIEAVVLQHLDAMNAGDPEARIGSYLSGATEFGLDSGLRATTGRSALAITANQRADLRVRDLRIKIHKDAAVATGYLVGTVTLHDGETKLITGRSTWVQVREHGQWRLAHTHLSPLLPDTSTSLH